MLRGIQRTIFNPFSVCIVLGKPSQCTYIGNYLVKKNEKRKKLRLVAQGTMEEKVYRRQVQKQGLAQRVLDEQQVGRFFSSGDLKELYMFECEDTPESEDDGGKRFKKPNDVIFADLLYQGNWSRRICKYHEVS